jgi:uncharacterized protein (TIGR04540 family)
MSKNNIFARIEMEVKKFYKTQRELASVINQLIDLYWSDRYSEEELNESLKKLYIYNSSKFLKQGEFTTVLKQVCGKRRLEVVNHILEGNDERMGENARI